MAFSDDIVYRLMQQNVAVINVNMFIGSAAVLPTTANFPVTDLTLGKGPYLTISETGGLAPTRIQNTNTPWSKRPTAQIISRAISPTDSRIQILAAYAALDGIFNIVLNGTFYYRLVARQEPTDLGWDGNGRTQFVFNVEAEKNPS